ncbi:hypothetical protein [Legionella jamestowniensis]|uniref:Uncharacterized protein n=1 Tax=Legionella jamestowniensis TaxID=455 RepID=A0A0W0UIJ6_9GAMM|nr:hypothetical protein [Legionella jamestowniensis]KTD07683.1 hypothetical protein Ljam_1878 [Legionella jamestowniensis]OCH99423.1 hypothetical protein A8135_07000 [Legionella jamestowniensis]SFL60599.1 hypothetical protein SAMN02746073_0997 [Legionella jamestowniensis DSM 19215]
MRLFTQHLSTLEKSLLRNLPAHVFSMLKDKNLTAQEAHEFISTDDSLKEDPVSISVIFQPATVHPEQVEIRIYSENSDSSLSFFFSNKIWLCTGMVNQGIDFIMEHSQQQSTVEQAKSTVEKGNKIIALFNRLEPIASQSLSHS